jgi:hypothetical protein
LAQYPHAIPVEKHVEQFGQRNHMFVGEMIAHQQVDDALRVAALADVTLAPARLLLGVAQGHGRLGYDVTVAEAPARGKARA